MPKSFYLRFVKFPVGITVMVGSFFIGFHKLIKLPLQWRLVTICSWRILRGRLAMLVIKPYRISVIHQLSW